MQLEIYVYSKNEWNRPFDGTLDSEKTLILLFGTGRRDLIIEPIKSLMESFKTSTILGASTAGEIMQDQLLDDSLVVAVMKFQTTTLASVDKPLTSVSDSYDDGVLIAKELLKDDLKAIFVLSDGLRVNGSQLTKGMASVLPKEVIVTGGLAADGDRFESTWVIVNSEPTSGFITAVGLYGDAIHIGYGSKGGWDTLGIERIVTKSKNNILYELDSQPALEIYKRYLGEQAQKLPASGLLFPLSLKFSSDDTEQRVRTILAVDEGEQSITFAGDIPEGSYVTLMKANIDRLVDGAFTAAEEVVLNTYNGEPILTVAISCVGRRLVLKQRIEEELEATMDVLPEQTKQIGFYSYGEISPLASGTCDLHNQTMTLTTIWESNAPSA